ncbi:SRPBCC family protein [Actinoplanes sp. N902-109]|uniref:SRPBCC family protein n=1 Tax=Actinoplanes sp. (strain N902-109) TaxID=649831 RepID=UPI0003295576|nr:SRPBCC family protein [Actinoplanes sp. N902-109]AGL19362.1 hypothetical protein L083_5852 [Actinoplanes sp. N902-109]
MRRQLAVSGPVPPGEAWDRYARPARWPEWSPQIRAVDYAGTLLTPGARGVVHGPLGLRVRFHIDDVTPARGWAWTVSVLGVTMHLHHTVAPAGPGSRTGLTIEGPAPVVLGYLPLARWALRRLVHLPPVAPGAGRTRHGVTAPDTPG